MIPNKAQLKKEKTQLRKLVDNSKDPAERRIAYAMEEAITWATEDTVGWGSRARSAKQLARFLQHDLENER